MRDFNALKKEIVNLDIGNGVYIKSIQYIPTHKQPPRYLWAMQEKKTGKIMFCAPWCTDFIKLHISKKALLKTWDIHKSKEYKPIKITLQVLEKL